MALKKYTCPPQGPAGSSTFSDDLVGFQLVTGGGLTQGNFEFATSFNEKTNRKFSTGTFSDPISLEGLGLESNNIQDIINTENHTDIIEYDYYPKHYFQFGLYSKWIQHFLIILGLKILK